MISAEQITRYDALFEQSKDQPTMMSGLRAKERWSAFGLDENLLMKIWGLADQTKVRHAMILDAIRPLRMLAKSHHACLPSLSRTANSTSKNIELPCIW